MQLLKNHAHIHRFEDYNLVTLSDFCFTASWSWNVPYNFDNNTGSYIINKDLPAKPYNVKNSQYDWVEYVKFVPDLATNHKELLDTAKKVFAHPTCKLSRSMMAEKYGKSSAQIILRWQLQAGFIAIPGSSNPDHIAENYDIFDFELSKEDMQRIRELDQHERYENW
jgi:hypothetical protein